MPPVWLAGFVTKRTQPVSAPDHVRRGMYDAIVIGARCAGSATAMLLAREGMNVLLVDRAELPSDIPHGHFIHRHGLVDWPAGACSSRSSRPAVPRSRR
jgi:glycine/D-amino acid oxidase-like deaminating enzyme